MSEFKFACPVCGQHITADSSASGGQIECPTCFQKILVPQAPATQDTKFILSAAQVGKPRPVSDAAAQLGPLQTSSPRVSISAVIALFILLCGVGAALYVFRDRVFKSLPGTGSSRTNALSSAPPPAALSTTYPVPTNFTWTLDLTNEVIPDTPAAGRIHGKGFLCEKSVLRGGYLSLNQGEHWPWDLSIAVGLFARQGAELSGKTVEIGPERPHAPRVTLRWKDDEQRPATGHFNRGYCLKVVFGQATNGHMPGKIYLCLPDEDKSFVAGTFDAKIQIRKPSPPGKRPPPTPRPKG